MQELDFTLDELLKNGGMTPADYQYYNGLSERRIIINDQITSDIVETVMLPLIEMDNDGTGEPITIILATIGGSTFDGMPLCDIIDNLKTPTTIIVPTYAYSMSGLILAAGYGNKNVVKKCYRHSTGLIHGGSTYLEGSSSSVKDTFHFHERYEKKIKEYILSHSKITEKEYNEIERYEFYMDAETMLEKGFIDEIIGGVE